MTRLNDNCAPAERLCNCTFAEQFRNAGEVRDNAGTIYGTPVFTDDGILLDGVGDHVDYNINGKVFNSEILSIVIEFTPNFSCYDGLLTYIFNSSTSAYLCKRDISNYLRISFGGVVIANIDPALYGPLWNVGQRNVFAVSGISGNTSAWLNGTEILTADPSIWTPSASTSINIGWSGGLAYFAGTIHSFKVFHHLLDAQDARYYYDNTMWNYRNDAVIDLPMGIAQHQGGYTLDVSGNGNHGLISGVIKIPDRHGYWFDAVNDYINCGNNNILSAVNEFTFMFAGELIIPVASTDYIFNYEDAVSGNYIRAYLFLNAGTLSIFFAFYDGTSWYARLNGVENYIVPNGQNTIVFKYNGYGTGNIQRLVIYINGKYFPVSFFSGTAAAVSPTVNASLLIGNTSTSFDGNITNISISKKALSSIQVADFHIRALAEVNNV